MKFVSFEIAKKLKEKGYPFNTSHHYDRDGDIIVALCDYDERCEYPIPEIHQVLKWLREEKKILITIIPQEKNLGYDTLCFVVYKITEDLYQPIYNGTANTLVDSYEATALAGIEYVLDNLI